MRRFFTEKRQVPVWWLIAMPLLAGVGVESLLEHLPVRVELWAIAAIALGGIVWCVREIRWSRRMQRAMEADMEFARIVTEAEEDFPW